MTLLELTPGSKTYFSYTGNTPNQEPNIVLIESEIKYTYLIQKKTFITMLITDSDKWTILSGPHIIFVREIGKIVENLIGIYTIKQKRYTAYLKSSTLKG